MVIGNDMLMERRGEAEFLVVIGVEVLVLSVSTCPTMLKLMSTQHTYGRILSANSLFMTV